MSTATKTKLHIHQDVPRLFTGLFDLPEDDMIDAVELAALIERMEQAKIRKAVTEAIKPYQRNGKEIVYYCPSKESYRIYIPKPLRREGETPPTNSKSESDLWRRAYEYIFDRKAKPTVADCYDAWKMIREADESVSSYTTYTDDTRYRRHIASDIIADKQINHVTPQDIKMFLKRIGANRSLSRKELRAVKSILNGIFSYAVDEGIVTFNPTLQVTTKDIKCKAVNNRDKIYSEEDRKRILNHLELLTKQTAYTLGIALMFCLCCRIGELKALKWADYDRRRKTIYIHAEIVTTIVDGKRQREEVDHTKIGEGGDRIQLLSDRALGILALAEQLHPDHKPDDYILPTTEGTPLYTNRFNQRLKQICERAGVRYLSSHKIRFYAVTAQARAGFDIGTIQQNAGHLNPGTTLGYIRMVQREAENREKWASVFN